VDKGVKKFDTRVINMDFVAVVFMLALLCFFLLMLPYFR